jgi:hypothetical protein
VLARYGREADEAKLIFERELAAFAVLPQTLTEVWLTPTRPGAWSPAQVTEHVCLVNVAASKVLYLLRREEPLLEGPRTRATVIGGRVQAPPFTLPGPSRPWEALHSQWRAMETRLAGEVAATRVWRGRRYFHPFFGDLCALEWLASASFHLAHHRKQLQRSALGVRT